MALPRRFYLASLQHGTPVRHWRPFSHTGPDSRSSAPWAGPTGDPGLKMLGGSEFRLREWFSDRKPF